MAAKPEVTDAATVDDLANRLRGIPDQTSRLDQAVELIAEVSELFSAASSLDPDAQRHAARSSYFARPSDDADQAG